MKWTDAYEHTGWTVTIPIKLIRAIGAKGAVLIAQLYHWDGKQRDPDGWIYKTKHELEEETGLALWEQDTCTAELKKKGILETRYARLDHRLYYRIKKDVLNSIMEATPPGEIGNHDFGKSENTISPKRVSSSRETTNPVLVNSQEITSEITTKKTTTTSATPDLFSGHRPSQMVVVASSPLAMEEDEPRDIVDKLTEEFGLSIPQGRGVEAHLAAKGAGYVIEKAEIVRTKKTVKNLAGAFMKALSDDWKAPKSISEQKPVKKPLPTEPENQDPPASAEYGLASLAETRAKLSGR
jgi:hypothetical protein